MWRSRNTVLTRAAVLQGCHRQHIAQMMIRLRATATRLTLHLPRLPHNNHVMFERVTRASLLGSLMRAMAAFVATMALLMQVVLAPSLGMRMQASVMFAGWQAVLCSRAIRCRSRHSVREFRSLPQ
jgi:hypothetical protein